MATNETGGPGSSSTLVRKDARIARLTSSSSWQLTAPLRSLISIVSVTRQARSKRRKSAQDR